MSRPKMSAQSAPHGLQELKQGLNEGDWRPVGRVPTHTSAPAPTAMWHKVWPHAFGAAVPRLILARQCWLAIR